MNKEEDNKDYSKNIQPPTEGSDDAAKNQIEKDIWAWRMYPGKVDIVDKNSTVSKPPPWVNSSIEVPATVKASIQNAGSRYLQELTTETLFISNESLLSSLDCASVSEKSAASENADNISVKSEPLNAVNMPDKILNVTSGNPNDVFKQSKLFNAASRNSDNMYDNSDSLNVDDAVPGNADNMSDNSDLLIVDDVDDAVPGNTDNMSDNSDLLIIDNVDDDDDDVIVITENESSEILELKEQSDVCKSSSPVVNSITVPQNSVNNSLIESNRHDDFGGNEIVCNDSQNLIILNTFSLNDENNGPFPTENIFDDLSEYGNNCR